LQAIADNAAGRVVLVVDQLEELATLTENAGERDAFMHALATAADDPDLPVRVIFTLRDDYLGRLASSAVVRRAFARVTVLERPTSAALKAILVQPLRAVGYSFEDDDLPSEMVAEVVDELAALPLLQFAGRQLWERRDQQAHRLTRRAYAELGGVSGALARHADGLLAGLTPEQEDGARQMLLRLVTSEGTRQVVGEPDLLEGLPTGGLEVLHQLVRGRLLSVRRGDARKPAEYELVHESLIRTWSRLQRWLDESREELTFLAEARQAATRWARQDRRDSELWQGHALLDAERALRHLAGVVPAEVEAFLAAGRRQATRRRRRFRILIGVLIAGLVLLAGVFRIQERRASSARGDAERQSTRARKQTAVAVNERGKAERRQVDLEIAAARAALKAGRIQEARARTRRALTTRDDVRARAIWWRIQREPLQWSRRTYNGAMTEIALSPDGAELLVTSGIGAMLRMDSRSGSAHEHSFKEAVVSPIYLPGGQRVAVIGAESKRLLLLDRKTGNTVRTFKLAESLPLGIFTGPRGQVLGAADRKGLRLFRRDRTEPWKVIPFGTQPGDLARATALSADRRFLATLHFDRGVRIWSLPEGRLLQRLPNRSPALDRLALTAKGRIVALPLDREIRVWHRQRPNRPVDIPIHSPVSQIRFLPDDRLMIIYKDGQLALHDPASGKRLRGIRLPEGPYIGIHVDYQSRWLVTCTAQGLVELRSLGALLSPVPRRGGHSPIWRLRYSPDGRLIASGEGSGAVRLWNARTGRERIRLSGHRSTVHRLAFSPNGRLLVTGSLDGALRIWDPANGRLLTAYQHEDAVAAIAFSPDGRWLVSADHGAFVEIRDVKTGGRVHRYREHYGVTDLVFSRDGRRLLVLIGWRKAVHLYETRGWRRLRSFTLPAVAQSLDYHPDGSRFAVGLVDGTVRLVPIAGGKPHTVGRFALEQVIDLRFDRSGRFLAATSAVAQRVWDVQTGRSLVRLAAPLGVGFSLDFAPTGRALLVGQSGYPRIHDARTGMPRWRTALVLPRADRVLSQRGWEHLDGRPASDPAPGKAWAAAVKSRAVYASASPDEALVCLVTPDHQVELWDVARDRRLWRRTVERTPVAQAVTGGCVVQELHGFSRSTTLLSRKGEVKRWEKLLPVVPVGSRGSLLMAENHLKVVDSHGRELERRAVQGQHQAAVLLGTRHAAGRLGSIEIYARPQRGQGGPVRLQGVSATDAPTFLAEGPAGTLLGGFDSGQVFLWDQRTGERLLGMKLQGAVFDVQRRLAKMHVFTFTGDRGTLDLTDLERPYCALLREVWREVPFGWARGAMVPAALPKGHRCQRTAPRKRGPRSRQ